MSSRPAVGSNSLWKRFVGGIFREKGSPAPVVATTPANFAPQIIAARAKAAPSAPAVVCGNSTLTFGALEEKSNRLAHYLQDLGCAPETVIAVDAGRSAELVIGALSAMKAGCAYLPIDPSWPAERVQFVLRDAQAPILLTANEVSATGGREEVVVINLNAEDAILAKYSEKWPPSELASSQLAYVIYTSGSTGIPKGVEITHGNLLNLIGWHLATFNIAENDRATMLASPGFDAAVWEVWPALCGGASLHVPSDAVRVSPQALRDWIVSEQITVTFVPTPLAQQLMFLEWPPETRLRTLLTGADVLQQYPPDGLQFVVVNNYGPTECTVVATSGVVRAAAKAAALPSIGKPIANTQVHILNEEMGEVPAGTMGELYIGGNSVGRGYRGDKSMTRAKFVPDPFRTQPGALLYRTGDRVRMLPDDSIEFIGRTDDQIKIRGYRIDPSEIVTQLCSHPAIQSSIVRKHVEPGGAEALVAYVLLTEGQTAGARELREHLRTRLPDYMVPGGFVTVKAFPLTSSGKVDREALPAPIAQNALPEERIKAPTGPATDTEAVVASMLSALLARTNIGAHDNFFLAGGHSLLGAQLLIQIQKQFAVDLPLRTIFDHPTIAGISAEIERHVAQKQAGGADLDHG